MSMRTEYFSKTYSWQKKLFFLESGIFKIEAVADENVASFVVY
jgi:hypothetical protein